MSEIPSWANKGPASTASMPKTQDSGGASPGAATTVLHMVDSGDLLKAEELDFLMDPEQFAAPAQGQQETGGGPEGQEVTIKGDLDQINLADIFTTLSMSKMEGTLRIKSPLEQREVLFRNGHVRCYLPARIESRRLGQRLVQAGLVNTEQLRQALQQQKETKKPIGQQLIDLGVIDADTLKGFLEAQSADDLHTLFTWNHGTFEFYRGACEDPVLREQLEQLPEFEVNSVLLDVARRSDEWARIVRVFASMDEVPQRSGWEQPDDLSELDARVLQAVTGQASIREVADASACSLFDCACALLRLHERGLVALLGTKEILKVAEMQAERGDLKRALVTAQTIHDRPEQELDVATVQSLVGILQRCGEARLAASYLLEAAQRSTYRPDTLELARRARTFDARSIPVLTLLRECLLESENELGDVARKELIDVLGGLADAHAMEQKYEEAIAFTRDVESLDPDNQANLWRKARFLHKLGRADDAVATLECLAATFKAERRTDRLAIVYEQILKIDYRRKDIAKALKNLHANRHIRILRHVGLALAMTLTAALGTWWFKERILSERIAEFHQNVQEQLDAGRTEQAIAILDSALVELGQEPAILALRERVRSGLEQAAQSVERKRKQALDSRLDAAADYIERGELGSALALYADLLARAREADRPPILGASSARLKGILNRIETQARNLPYLLPHPPNLLLSEAVRTHSLKELQTNFKDGEDRWALGVQRVQDDPTLEKWLSQEERARLAQAAGVVVQAFKTARQRLAEYTESLARLDSARRLEPLLVAAREHEQRYEFQQALDSYRRLLSEHPTDDDLKAHFRDQVERYSGILRFQQVIEKATQDGDFASAQGQLRALKRSHPQIPFESLTELPLRVESLPAGAIVHKNAIELGRTPLTIRYKPGDDTRISVQREGFIAEEVAIKGDQVGLVRSLLARSPLWQAQLGGAVERMPAADAQGRLFVVDRAGGITAFAQDSGRKLWSYQAADLSALLTSPLPTPAGLVVASVDGDLRCFDPETGDLRWEKQGLPVEARPMLCGNLLVVATINGQLYGLDPRTGTQQYRVDLPGGVRARLAARNGQLALATRNGFLCRVRASDGGEVWRQKLGAATLTAPVYAEAAILVGGDDGQLQAFHPDDGRRLWRRGDLGDLVLSPVLGTSAVFVGEGRSVFGFRIADGEPIGKQSFEQLLANGMTCSAQGLLVSLRSGSVLVLDPATMQVRYRMRGQKGSNAPPLVLDDGIAIIAFGDRSLQAFALMP